MRIWANKDKNETGTKNRKIDRCTQVLQKSRKAERKTNRIGERSGRIAIDQCVTECGELHGSNAVEHGVLFRGNETAVRSLVFAMRSGKRRRGVVVSVLDYEFGQKERRHRKARSSMGNVVSPKRRVSRLHSRLYQRTAVVESKKSASLLLPDRRKRY